MPGAGRQALDRRDARAVDLADRDEARIDRRAVEQDGAGAALALAAALLGAGQARGPRAGRRAAGACPGTSTSTGVALTVKR